MSGSPGADGSEPSAEDTSLSTGSKTGSMELLNGEMVSKPSRPPPPSQSQVAKFRRKPPPPVRTARSMTLTGSVPKAAEIARARARARASLNMDTADLEFASVRHLVSPPLVEQRDEVFSFDKVQRFQRARSFSPSGDEDSQSAVAALNKARNRKSLSPDSSSSHSLVSDKVVVRKGSVTKSARKDDSNRSKSDESAGETSLEADSSKTSSSSSSSTPPKRPPRPYAPPIFEAKVARKRPPPVPHVIDVRDSSPQMIKAGKSPPVPKTTIVDTRNQTESPKRPPLPPALAQSSTKKVSSKDDSTSPVTTAFSKQLGQDEANRVETTPNHRTPVVRFASPPPTVSSSSKSTSSSKPLPSSKPPSSLKTPSPPLQENSVSDKQESKTSRKVSPPRPTPTVKFNLDVSSQSSDAPTSAAAAATKATPTPAHLNLTQPDSESDPSLSSPVEEEKFGSLDGVVASGKSPSPSRSRRFIKSMKQSFRNPMKRKRVHEGSATVCNRSNTLPSSGHEEDPSPGNRQQPSRSRTVYAGAHHDNGVYDKDKYPDELPQGIIDPVIVKAIAYLNKEQVLLEEGLFRIPGDLTAIKSLRARFSAGEDVDLNEVLDPHTIAGLLKVHFREMRVSIIPRGPRLAELVKSVQSRDVELFSSVIATIEPHHLATIRMLAEVLAKIAANSSKNRMTSGTLATSCGPSIFPYLPPSNANAIIKFLVDHCDEIFTE